MKKSNIQKHFEKELEILEQDNNCKDLTITPYVKDIKKLIKTFNNQGHSGYSAMMVAPYLADVIKRILMFETISPLTGKDDEFSDISRESGDYLLQNKRNSAVFKRKDGYTYNDMIIWQGEDKYDTFTGTVQGINSTGIVFNKFPIYPKRFYIDVHKVSGRCGVDNSYLEDDDGNEFHYEINPGQQDKLKEIQDYYDLGEYFISF